MPTEEQFNMGGRVVAPELINESASPWPSSEPVIEGDYREISDDTTSVKSSKGQSGSWWNKAKSGYKDWRTNSQYSKKEKQVNSVKDRAAKYQETWEKLKVEQQKVDLAKQQAELQKQRIDSIRKPVKAVTGNLSGWTKNGLVNNKQLGMYDTPSMRTLTNPHNAKGSTFEGLGMVRQEISPARHNVIEATKPTEALKAVNSSQGLARVKSVTLPSNTLRNEATVSPKMRSYNSTFTKYGNNLSPMRSVQAPKLAGLQRATNLTNAGSSPLAKRMLPKQGNMPLNSLSMQKINGPVSFRNPATNVQSMPQLPSPQKMQVRPVQAGPMQIGSSKIGQLSLGTKFGLKRLGPPQQPQSKAQPRYYKNNMKKIKRSGF